MKHLLLPALLLCLASIPASSQTVESMPVTVFDSATHTYLDSVTLTLGEYKNNKLKEKKKVLVNGTTTIGGKYLVISAERKGYRTNSNITDSNYKLVNYGKSTGYTIEIPMQKLKSGVKLVPK